MLSLMKWTCHGCSAFARTRSGLCLPVHLASCDSLALLGHWRVVGSTGCQCIPSSRANFSARVPLKRPDFHLYQQPSPLVDTAEMDEEFVVIDEVGSEEETDPVPSAEHQEITAPTASTSHGAVDSHFHLDRATHHIMGKDAPLCIPNLITSTDGVPPQYPVQVTGGVCVFCDPATYPDVFPSFTGFKCAVGFHPRHALRFDRATLHRILELLKSPAVAAFGEIGLDHTEPESTWQKQAEVFSSLLEYSMPARPLVLHLRGRDDLYSTECSLAALNLARVGLASTQRIHLHCFTGNPALMHDWLQQFPRCYFGFTGLVRSFDSQQIQALTKVPTDRLLIETDSPYLRPSKGRNTPAYPGDVAVLIAKPRKLHVEELLNITAVNAQQLYHLD